MPKKGYSPEQIIHKLREAEVLSARETLSEQPAKRSASVTSRITTGEKSTVACEQTKRAGSRDWKRKTLD